MPVHPGNGVPLADVQELNQLMAIWLRDEWLR